MSRYTGPTWKISRRLGYSILETGVELKKRSYGPGPHAKDKRKKPSEYGKQLIEKQKLREEEAARKKAEREEEAKQRRMKSTMKKVASSATGTIAILGVSLVTAAAIGIRTLCEKASKKGT